MIKVVAGAMWSGKTFLLLQELYNAYIMGKKTIAFDHKENNRNSDRDLKGKKLIQQTDISDHDLIIFDEVHMYSVFGNEDDLLDTIATAKESSIVICAGLYYDFYNNYHIFPIWQKIMKKWKCEFSLLESRILCHGCGNSGGVYYTVSDGSTENRVGDHYFNVCGVCKDKYYKDYVAKYGSSK